MTTNPEVRPPYEGTGAPGAGNSQWIIPANAAGYLARWFWFSILVLVVGLPMRAQEEATSEYKLKAAFLFNFAKFVEWPPEAFSDTNSPFTIGIIGENPFKADLEEMVQQKTINGRPFIVRQCKSLAELKNCQILFIHQTERKRLAEILRAIRGGSVLTVSEMDRFLTNGGMIQFLMEENKVRFAINDSAAKQAGLRISSKLLNLARRLGPEAAP